MDLVEPVDNLNQSDLLEWVMDKGPLNTKHQCQLLYQTADSLSYLNTIHNTIQCAAPLTPPPSLALSSDTPGRAVATSS